jgi:hypothetical protein
MQPRSRVAPTNDQKFRRRPDRPRVRISRGRDRPVCALTAIGVALRPPIANETEGERMMRIHFVWLTVALLSWGGLAHADRAAIQLRLVTTAGTALPTREGSSITVGPSLLAAPLELVSVDLVRSEVRLGLGPTSTQAVAELTAHYRGRRLAIVVDGVVQSTPVVKSAIVDGKLAITLRSPAAAADLARALDRK